VINFTLYLQRGEKFMSTLANRSINICLINTNKVISGVTENTSINVNHNDVCIFFNTQAERDNYFALKTVESQTQNSKVHDFNSIGSIRLDINMSDYYALKVDLIKINHTVEKQENEYIYNINSVSYVNNKTTMLHLSLNPIYTYFLGDNTESFVHGMVHKANFRDYNHASTGYLNSIAPLLVGGDNYDTFQASAINRNVYRGTEPEIVFMTVSMRKRQTMLDDLMNTDILTLLPNSTFADEITLLIPVNTKTSAVFSTEAGGTTYIPHMSSGGNLNANYVAYLLMNGAVPYINVGSDSLAHTAVNLGLTVFVDKFDVPFTFHSFYEISEIVIQPYCPFPFTLNGDTVSISGSVSNISNTMFNLKDIMNERVISFGAFTFKEVANSDMQPYNVDILTNENKRDLIAPFTNVENAMLYKQYYINFFGLNTQVNGVNLFSTDSNIGFLCWYLGNNFKKFIFKPDEPTIGSLSISGQLKNRQNTVFGINYYGANNFQSDASGLGVYGAQLAAQTGGDLLGMGADMLGNIMPGLKKFNVGGGISQVGDIAANAISIGGDISGSQNVHGGTSGYSTSATYSQWVHKLEEATPMLITDYTNSWAQIDAMTDLYGTSCNYWTNNLNDTINTIINNRDRGTCYIKGNFKSKFIYAQASPMIQGMLANGILFIRKL
jgi:hypothetical protein